MNSMALLYSFIEVFCLVQYVWSSAVWDLFKVAKDDKQKNSTLNKS